MTPIRLLTRPATLVVRTAAAIPDEYGDLVHEEDTLEVVCEVQQKTRRELEDGALQESRWRAYLPAGVALAGWDALEVDGARFEVVGPPWPVRNPRTGAVSHVEADLRRVA